MIFDVIPNGSFGRWTIGLVVLVQLIAFNETGAITAMLATVIATICAIFSAICKCSLSHLQMPYLRATHKFDFLILFCALWMDILTLICACGALARTMSVCLDSMTGGMARIYILGRNAPSNEPWPDVIGFSITFLVSVMFMLGLENSTIFSGILVASVTGVIGIFVSVASLRGSFEPWQTQEWLPQGVFGLLSTGALLVFAHPADAPSSNSTRRFHCTIVCLFFGLTYAVCFGCLSFVLYFSPPDDFLAVPMLSILETTDFHSLEPAIACLFVMACSCAFIELFAEMFSLIVKLTTSEWKILSRQIGYENSDSGSPVLAIFAGGSICAMIAFACPLKIIIYLIAGCQLTASLFRAIYLLYSPFRPKYIVTTQNDSSLSYSRLSTSSVKPSQSTVSFAASTATTAGNVSRRIIRCLSKPKIVPLPKTRTKNKQDEELEREWLLLGDPQSPRNTVLLDDGQDIASIDNSSPVDRLEDVESALTSDALQDHSVDSASESSTDIDAIVDEYRQKVKVTTAGSKEKIIRVPSSESWRLAIVCLTFLSIGMIAANIGIQLENSYMFASGMLIVILFNIIMCFLPRHNHTQTDPSALCCSIGILMQTILIGASALYSLPAVISWLIAGILIYARCDTWCSFCIEQPIYINHIVSTSAGSSGVHVSSIRMPRPPKGVLIPSRVHGQCR